MFYQTMLGSDMPDYCTMRYTKSNGVKGLRFMSNDPNFRGIEAYVGDTRNRNRRDFRFIQGRPGTRRNTVENSKPEIFPTNLTHYNFNPYSYEEPLQPITKIDLMWESNFWRKFQVEKVESSEYTYEYFVELDPAERGYRAFILNMQFMGM